MNPQVSYQASMARIDELHREAAKNSLRALAVDGRRRAERRGLHLPKISFRLPARQRLA